LELKAQVDALMTDFDEINESRRAVGKEGIK
jgi:hypothetical protein